MKEIIRETTLKYIDERDNQFQQDTVHHPFYNKRIINEPESVNIGLMSLSASETTFTENIEVNFVEIVSRESKPFYILINDDFVMHTTVFSYHNSVESINISLGNGTMEIYDSPNLHLEIIPTTEKVDVDIFQSKI